jgi:hypothetical protein
VVVIVVIVVTVVIVLVPVGAALGVLTLAADLIPRTVSVVPASWCAHRYVVCRRTLVPYSQSELSEEEIIETNFTHSTKNKR